MGNGGSNNRQLWHGTPYLIDLDDAMRRRLYARPSNVLGGESAVFAATERRLALLFAMPNNFTTNLTETGYFGPKNGSERDMTFYVGERKPGVFKRLNGQKKRYSGYIYHIDAEDAVDFHTDSRLGMPTREKICDHSVKVDQVEFIEDVWEAIRRDDTIVKMTYEDVQKTFK